MTQPTLTLGSFNLTAGAANPQFAGAAVMAEGTSRGNPVPLEVAVQSWLQDGAIVVTQGYDNREVLLRVRLGGSDLTATAALEAALHAELGKPNTLTWTPTGGPAAVFNVVTSSMVQDDTFGSADILESQHHVRLFQLRLVCEAFPSSATETVTAALPATGATTTLLDACAAATGWSGTVDGVAVTPTSSGGSVLLTASLGTGAHTMALQKTFAATTTSTKWLTIDWKPPTPARFSTLSAIGDGVTLPLIFEGPSPTSGYVRSMFQVAASSLAVTKLVWTGNLTIVGGGTLSEVLSVDNVAVSNVNPTFGTGRQQLRSLTVTGSAPARGALALESTTAALGDDTMLYVYPSDASTNGYSPPLRQFRVLGGTVTADAAKVSGSFENLDGGSGVIFNIPIGLFPRGSYVLMARLSTAGATLTYSTSTLIGAGSTGVTSYPTLAIPTTAGAYKTIAIAKLQLPTTDLDQTANAAGVLMQLTMSTSAACNYDEVWLFNTTIGALIWLDCGTGAGTVGGSARRLFVEPPTVAVPRLTLRIGHSADRSDSYFPPGKVKSWQIPEVNPPQVNAFFVTPNATDAALSMRYYPRWFGNPAA